MKLAIEYADFFFINHVLGQNCRAGVQSSSGGHLLSSESFGVASNEARCYGLMVTFEKTKMIFELKEIGQKNKTGLSVKK